MLTKFVIYSFILAIVASSLYISYESSKLGVSLNAKLSCSIHFTAGRSDAPELNWFPLTWFPVVIDEDKLTVTSSTPLYPFATSTAIYRPEMESCILLPFGEQSTSFVDGFDSLNFHKPTISENKLKSIRSENVDYDLLEYIMEEVFDEPFVEEAGFHRLTRAVVIMHKDEIVFERYAEGFDRNTRLLGWSMCKSILSTLLGMRIDDGKLSLDQTNLCADSDKSNIALKHYLEGTSGIGFTETYDSFDDASKMLFMSGNTSEYACGCKVDHAPGTHFEYSSGNTNILSKALRDSFDNDGDYLKYPYERLFAKIGAPSFVMDVDASGTFVGSSFAWGTARDWVRFGQLWKNGGKVNNEQVLSEEYIKYAVGSHNNVEGKHKYGAHWWVNTEDKDGNLFWDQLPADTFAALGYEEQSVVVIPSKDLVVVRLGATSPKMAWNLQNFIYNILLCLED